MNNKGDLNNNKISKDMYDDTEDLDIRGIAYYKDNIKGYLLILLSISLLGIILISISSYGNYTIKKKNKTYDEVIEISNDKGDILITNENLIDEEVTNDSFSEMDNEYVVKNVNSITLNAKKEEEKDVTVKYDIKYIINDNTFKPHAYNVDYSDILVRFSYSYDLDEWIDVKNVISLTESALNPLMGNLYDISGIKDTLNVATNKELIASPGKSNTIYWRSETIFKYNHITNFKGSINANFKIEYKGID